MLVGGFLLKAQCLQPYDGRQYARLCYNDLQPLFGVRGIDQGIFPYIHGSMTPQGELVEGAIEYPVLTGLFMYLSGRLAIDSNSYLVISAVLLAPFGLLAAHLLGRLQPHRAWMWALAPALVLYAFHNWDLLVVAATVAGFYAWSKGRSGWAAAAFGVGGALKMYPLLFLAPLVLTHLRDKDRVGALRSAAAGVGTFAAINLPFALVNFPGWWATYAFHRARGPNYDAIWTWPPSWFPVSLTPDSVNFMSTALIGLFAVVALAVGWRRARSEGTYPFVEVSAALLAAFLLWNKVHSPQYTLWLLPFLVLVRVHVGWWIAYTVVDLMVYVGVFRFFYDSVYQGIGESLARDAMIAGVWLRAGLLLAIFVAFLMARSRLDPAVGAATKTSQPPSNLEASSVETPV